MGYNTIVDNNHYAIWKVTTGLIYTPLVITSRVPLYQLLDRIKFSLTDIPGGINLSLWVNETLFGSYDDLSPLPVGGPAIQILQPGGDPSIPNITNFSIESGTPSANQGNVLHWL